ncbi:MAG: hypothetical protein Q8876_05050, partial [Bacillota bacterium]|nr:hypothetical protein [Bacillota bacterium]
MNRKAKKIIRKSTSLLLSILLVISLLAVGAISASAATIPASTDFYFDASNASSYFGTVYMSVTSSANSSYTANASDTSGANSYSPGGDTWYTMTNLGNNLWKATVTASSTVGKVSFWSVNENNYNQVWQTNCSLGNTYDGTDNLFTVGSAYSTNSGRQSKCFSGTWTQYGTVSTVPVFTNSTTAVSAQVNTTVTLNSAATISGGTTPTYQTTCSNQNVTIGSATTASPTFIATATGTYTVVTTATNPNTNETATKTYTVTVTNTAVIPANTDIYFNASNVSSYFGTVYMSVTSSGNSNYVANAVETSGASSYYPGGDTWYTMTNLGNNLWKATVTTASSVGKVSFWSVNESNYNQVWQANCSLGNSYDGTNNEFTVVSGYLTNSGRQSNCFSGTWSHY